MGNRTKDSKRNRFGGNSQKIRFEHVGFGMSIRYPGKENGKPVGYMSAIQGSDPDKLRRLGEEPKGSI